MDDKPVRLGSVVEDYCSRCKLLLDHAVQAIVQGQIQSVVCKTCMHTHPYRHGKTPRKKNSKQSLFDQILAKRPPAQTFAMPTTKKPAAGDREED